MRDQAVKADGQESEFGGCPECGKTEGYRNVGRDHWFFCLAHKTRWCVGSNLFSSWRYETEDDWRRNRAMLAGFREVAPVFPKHTLAERLRRALWRVRGRIRGMFRSRGKCPW